MNFLSNGEEKVIKTHDGRMWLASVSVSPNESENGHEDRVTTSFDFVESGNPILNEDLYNANLIDYQEN